MSKVRLILTPEYLTIFRSHYLEYIWNEYFIIEEDTGQNADKNTIFIGPDWFSDWAKKHKQDGKKLAFDSSWEFWSVENEYNIKSANWFWYNESLWYQSLGYNNYIPNCEFEYLAFMPMRSQQSSYELESEELLDKLGSRIDKFLWSYKEKSLPNDLEITDNNYQRFFNPKWYNSTKFSLVYETSRNYLHVTEKTFKPMAFNHPFLIWGPAGTLSFLKQNKFETFDEIFDETYDLENCKVKRLEKIISNIDNFFERTKTTEEKIIYNRHRFYDTKLIEKNIVNEIVIPLLEYAET